MDCFVAAARARRDIGFCDELLASSDLGVLKAEDPARFFGPWLDRHGLSFADAILVDDSPRNCVAFELYGGRAELSLDPWIGFVLISGLIGMILCGWGRDCSAGLPSVLGVRRRVERGCGCWWVLRVWAGVSGRQVVKTVFQRASQASARGQRAGRCRTGRRWGRASRAGTLMRWARRVAPRATA